MDCDGEATIWCPVSDFFGSGVGLNAVQSWYRTVLAGGTLVCRWVMPYQKNARIALANLGKQPVQVSLRATVGPWVWDERSMHFHAVWHYEAGLKTPPHRDWNYVQVTGHGMSVGDTLALYNPIATWYGEGDEKIWVDGESFRHMSARAPRITTTSPTRRSPCIRLRSAVSRGWTREDVRATAR